MDRRKEERLHKKSLILARMFRDAYARHGKDNPVTQHLLELYKQARRDLPGEVDEHGHSTRYGAYDAYLSTQ